MFELSFQSRVDQCPSFKNAFAAKWTRSIVNSVRNSCTVHRNSGVLVKRWFQNHKTVNLRVLFNRINFLTVNSAIFLFYTFVILQDNLNPSNIALRVFSNGTVLYSMRRHLVLNCEGDLHIFPFDSPMCSFSIESSKCHFRYIQSGKHSTVNPSPPEAMIFLVKNSAIRPGAISSTLLESTFDFC